MGEGGDGDVEGLRSGNGKMKIAAVHSFLTQNRGAELAFLDMMLSLRRRGHEIDVFTLSISDYYDDKFKRNGINVHSMNFKDWKLPIPKINIIRKIYPIYSYYKLLKEVNTNNYDVAFVHHYSSSLVIPFLKIPKIYYCQEPLRGYYEPRIEKGILKSIVRIVMRPYKYIDRYSVKRADLVLSNSDYTREYIWKAYDVFSITNHLGVHVEKFKKMNVKNENLVLSIGPLNPYKAHDFIIRSIGLIPKDKRPRLLIVGSGRDKEKLQNMGNDCGVELEMKSNISDEELVELYNKVRITVIAYIMEPFGLTAIESMACETPVVAVREGGLRESIKNGETGILTNRAEAEFAKAIEYLLDNSGMAAEMGKNGRERVKRYFTWDRCGEELEKNIIRMLSNKKDRKNRVSWIIRQ